MFNLFSDAEVLHFPAVLFLLLIYRSAFLELRHLQQLLVLASDLLRHAFEEKFSPGELPHNQSHQINLCIN